MRMNKQSPALPPGIAPLAGSAESMDVAGMRARMPSMAPRWPVAVGENAAEPSGASRGSRHVVFVAWRDLANPHAGGSEILVDRLAAGVAARGDRVTLLCGGPTGERPYQVV